MNQLIQLIAQLMGGQQKPQESFDTKLSPDEEAAFQVWKQKYAPRDSGADYDLRGAWKAGLKPDAQSGHWSDQFKKPNHPTFSNESQYSKGRTDAGSWQGPNHDQFVPAPEQVEPGVMGNTSTSPLSALTGILPIIAQLMGNTKPLVQQDPNMVGPPESTLGKDNREMKQWATNPQNLNSIMGSMMGVTGGVGPRGWGGESAAPQSVTHLQRMIEEHGIPSKVDGNGNLWAMESGTTKEGAAHHKWVPLPASIDAVKSWLGY